MKKRIQLARPGTFGQAGTTVTLQDLQEIVETFSGTAPITLGHQLADWMPAFGKVTSVALEQQDGSPVLTGEIELTQLLADAVDEGFFQSWSIGAPKRGADGKRYLHHLAVLGATPPKVPGLKELAINMSDCPATDLWTFGDLEDKAGFLARINQEKEHAKWRIEDVKSILDRIVGWALEQAVSGTVPAEFKDQVQLLADRLKPAASPDPEKLALADKVAAYETKLREGAKDQLRQAAEGRIPASAMHLALALADQVKLEDTLELSDSDGQSKKLTGLDLLKELFSSIPLPVQPGTLKLADTSETLIDMTGILRRI